MDESVVKHLAKTGSLTLSAAIRIGCPWVKESDIYSGCAIGTGYRVLTGRDLTTDWIADMKRDPEDLVAKAFRVPRRIVGLVSQRHFRGDWTRLECAAYLESKGY